MGQKLLRISIFFKIAQNINIFSFQQSEMSLFHQKLAIIALMVRLTFGSIINLQYNHVYTINQNPYVFSQLTVTKIYDKYLYVSQATRKIRKINQITGTQQGVFTQNVGQIINDFVIYSNGTKMTASYYPVNMVISWNTSSFANISESSNQCFSVSYLQNVNRFICSVQSNQNLQMSGPNLSNICNHQLASNGAKHKFRLSSNKQRLISINENLEYKIGSFSYTSSSMSFTQWSSGTVVASSFNRRIYTSENVPFTFYLISQNRITQVTADNSTVGQYHHNQTDIIVAFKQLANDRFAYVMQNSNHKVYFKGKGGFSGQYLFSIPEAIKGLQATEDNKRIILILQTQIQVYQFACVNNQYYDSTTFDCKACLQGFFANNYNCSVCDISCKTCQNITGCVTCDVGLTQIGIGLLCSNATNSSPSNITSKNDSTDLTNQTVPQNETKAIQDNILEGLTYFMTIPPALKIPLQSLFLVCIADFWIYIYHNRTYGQKVSYIFQFIQTIETHKWTIAKFDKHLNITLDLHYLGFSNYSNYSNPKFLAIERKSSILFESLKQYFLYFTPTVILVFLLYRFIFCITFNYAVSKHFRKYSFNLFIIFLLTEGNFEYLCYCCFNQSQILYFFHFIDKINAWVWMLLFFLATIHAFAGFYISYWFYPRLGGKFIDEAKKMLPSFTMYTIMTNSKNFILAAIQSFLFKYYVAQMFTMLGVHFVLIVIMLYCQIKYGIFKRAIFFNFLLLQAAIKIMVNFLLLIQYCVWEGDNATFNTLEDFLIIALYLWGILMVFGIITSFFPQTTKIKKQILQHKSKQQENNQQCCNLSEKINNSAQKTESKQEKDWKSTKEKLKKSIRFANRQDVVIIEYQNQEPMPLNNQRKNQRKQKTMHSSSSISNQHKKEKKNPSNFFKQLKSGQHWQIKKTAGILELNIRNENVFDNNIQQIVLDPKQQEHL